MLVSMCTFTRSLRSPLSARVLVLELIAITSYMFERERARNGTDFTITFESPHPHEVAVRASPCGHLRQASPLVESDPGLDLTYRCQTGTDTGGHGCEASATGVHQLWKPMHEDLAVVNKDCFVITFHDTNTATAQEQVNEKGVPRFTQFDLVVMCLKLGAKPATPSVAGRG